MSRSVPVETLDEHNARNYSKPCYCPHEWKGLGLLYGISMGHDWVRMTTVPGCPEHDPTV